MAAWRQPMTVRRLPYTQTRGQEFLWPRGPRRHPPRYWEHTMAKAHTLRDDFNGTSTDTSKWVPFGTYTQVNQRLELVAEGAFNASSGYVSSVTYDLTGSSFRLKVLQTLRAVLGARTYLRAFVTEGVDEVGIRVENGLLCCEQTVASTRTPLASVPYDPELHRWWRLREGGGTTCVGGLGKLQELADPVQQGEPDSSHPGQVVLRCRTDKLLPLAGDGDLRLGERLGRGPLPPCGGAAPVGLGRPRAGRGARRRACPTPSTSTTTTRSTTRTSPSSATTPRA